MKDLRDNIDKIDQKILILIKKRFDLAKKIGKYKKEKNISIKDKTREEEIVTKKIIDAQKLELSPTFIKKVWMLLFDESRRLQK